jgi:hypothetical protein
VIHVVTLLWAPNRHSFDFSRMYDESWVEKLYRGFNRNLTQPFRFVCFVDREREFAEDIVQVPIRGVPSYASCIQPYELGKPMILVGLDTVVTGNCDHLAEYALTQRRFAMPRDPFYPHLVCNGVGLVPEGHDRVAWDHLGQNDMDWIRANNPAVIDDIFPGHVVSFKGHVQANGLGNARIVYFHGEHKAHELDDDWIKEHWR